MPHVRWDIVILVYWMWKLTTLMERTRRETRIQRAALVCKPHLSSSAILHFPAFPNAPVWSFTITRLPPSPPPTLSSMNPPRIPTSCFIFCFPRRWRCRHMWNRRRESSFESSREGRRQRRTVSDTSSWQLGPPRGGKKTCAPAGGGGTDKICGTFCDTNTRGDSTFKEAPGWWNMDGAWVTGNKGMKFCCAAIWRVSREPVPKDAASLKTFIPCCHKFQF